MFENILSIFMPAFNAANHISSVVKRIPDSARHCTGEIWIINDGSTDGTQAVIDTLQKSDPALRILHLPGNRGYGTAVQIGIRKCRENGCAYALCLHADGQYPPESIPQFLAHMQKWNCDILQGSRIASGTALSGGMPLYKYCAGKVLTFLENRVFHLAMSDYHSGFIMYSRKALNLLPFHRFSRSFDFDLEVIACARSRGLRIDELPIPTHYGTEKSYLNPIGYGFRALFVVAKYLLGMYGGRR